MLASAVALLRFSLCVFTDIILYMYLVFELVLRGNHKYLQILAIRGQMWTLTVCIQGALQFAEIPQNTVSRKPFTFHV